MSMTINSTYGQAFAEQVKRDFKEIDKLPVSKLNTLDDLMDTKGKLFKTADIEKLMEKYDPEAYEEYKKFAYRADGGHSQSGLSYLSGWMDDVKAGKIKDNGNSAVNAKNDISTKNEEKLSKKAQDFLKNLREKYGDFDFMIGNSRDELMALSKTGCKEFSVIFSSAEIERMANDEKYAEEKMQGVAGSVRMARQVAEEYGFGKGEDGQNGTINKIGVVVNDDGSMKLFAELEKSSAKQRERINKAHEKHAEEKKDAERAKRKNPYEKDEKPSVKRTTVEANSIEELMEKINNIEWDKVENSYSGDRVNYAV